jgi:hypothetical protein
MYRKNIADTENEINRFDDNIWNLADAERANQNNQEVSNSAPKPPKRIDGPIDPENKNTKKIDEQ